MAPETMPLGSSAGRAVILAFGAEACLGASSPFQLMFEAEGRTVPPGRANDRTAR
jgi:hypothetical protein